MSSTRPQGPAGPRAAADRPTGPHGGRGSSLNSSNHHRSNRNDRAVVVGILGKSRFGKSAIANTLLDRPVFQSIPLNYSTTESKDASPEPAALDLYHDTEKNVIYLSIVSNRDSSQMFNSIIATPLESINSPEAAHDWIHRHEQSDLRAALFLFCVSHIILVAQPSPRLEMEWVRCLRVLQAVKEQAGPMLHGLLTAAAAAKMIDVNVHFLHSNLAPVKVTPILAFVFDDSSLASVKARKCDGVGPPRPDFSSASAAAKEEKQTPYSALNAKLQQALESQVRTLLKKPKAPGGHHAQQQRGPYQPFSKLFQLDITQAAHVITLSEDNYAQFNSHLPPWAAVDYSCFSWDPTPASGSTLAGVTNSPFIFPPIDLVTRILNDDSGKFRLRRWLQSKIEAIQNQAQQPAQPQQQGSNHQQQQHKQRSNDLLTSTAWFAAANMLRDRLIYGQSSTAELENHLARLRTNLDPEAHLSAELCKHAYSAARSVYFSDLPPQYPTAIHSGRIELAKKVFLKLARGPAAAEILAQLVAETEKYWRDGHQRCDAVSVTMRNCVHPWHLTPGQPAATGSSSVASDPPKTLEHSSGYRSMSACNCGRTRRIREDPFDLEVANYSFFIADCCAQLPSHLPQAPVSVDATDDAPSAQGPLSSSSNNHPPPKYHSWSVLTLASSTPAPATPAKSSTSSTAPAFIPLYIQEKGFQQDGILAGFATFLPWDISISKVKAAARVAPAKSVAAGTASVSPQGTPKTPSGVKLPSSPSPVKQPSSPSPQQRGPGRQQANPGGRAGRRGNMEAPQSQDLVEYLDKALKEKDTRRAYVGIEYECPLGHRSFANADLVAAVMGLKAYVKSGKVDLDRLLSEQELPVFIPCPCGKNSLAQLQRIYFVTPEVSSSLRFSINPIVQFSIPPEAMGAKLSASGPKNPSAEGGSGSVPTITFQIGSQVVIPGSEYSIVVIRFPYVYSTPRKPLVQTGPNVPYKVSLLAHAIKPV
eukprot:TRINITY_DN10118_c0_g1_i1.p1 TRINITY_DN10118_c0_g1~~TRINITY_DN10118_c0_g1_i1.p1  ORF type:complete len:986 (+),score=151.58 TRINITY_DN10118_c0_g1_i1:38-2995(+)